MERRLKALLVYYMALDMKNMDEEKRHREANELLIQVSFLQHERMIHLMVTILFSVLTVGVMLFTIVHPQLILILLEILLLILLIPYIRHYYILENGIQKLYQCYDRLVQSEAFEK